jgi:hypothetical protein
MKELRKIILGLPKNKNVSNTCKYAGSNILKLLRISGINTGLWGR